MPGCYSLKISAEVIEELKELKRVYERRLSRRRPFTNELCRILCALYDGITTPITGIVINSIKK